jgi:cell pole-organizing protein PopZ
MTRICRVRSAMLTLFVVSLSALSFADDSPNPGQRGDAYQLAAGKTYNMHAHDHARLLGKFAAAAEHPVSSDVLAPHLASIRANADAAQKAYKRMSARAKNDPQLKNQLAEIEQRLTKVSQLVNQLEVQSAKQNVEAIAVLDRTNAISRELKQTHLASKQIDRMFGAAIQTGGDFSDRDSDSYYFTGEGHFID